MNPRAFVAALTLAALPMFAAAEDGLGTVEFFRSESGPAVLTYVPDSVVFSAVKGKDFAADEMLALIETRLTRRVASGSIESTRHWVVALCGRGTMLVLDFDGKPISAESLSPDKFAPAEDPRMERFRIALCAGELRGVPPPSTGPRIARARCARIRRPRATKGTATPSSQRAMCARRLGMDMTMTTETTRM